MGSTEKTALELQRNYQREWRRKNKDKVKKYNKWTIVKKVDRGMRKISKAQPRHAGRTKVQPD